MIRLVFYFSQYSLSDFTSSLHLLRELSRCNHPDVHDAVAADLRTRLPLVHRVLQLVRLVGDQVHDGSSPHARRRMPHRRRVDRQPFRVLRHPRLAGRGVDCLLVDPRFFLSPFACAIELCFNGFSPVGGFSLLVLGTLLYNGILRIPGFEYDSPSPFAKKSVNLVEEDKERQSLLKDEKK